MTETAASTDAPIDPIALRRAFGTFVTGVTVITTRDEDGTPRGMTANSFTSVSLDPPLLLVCVAKSASSYHAFTRAGCFAVNVLHEGQVDVSGIFASKSQDKFQSVTHDHIHTGAPVLTDSLTWFDCTTSNTVDAGDHAILIGEVRAFGTSPTAPLGFCRGRYASVKDPLPNGWLASHGMIIGYLIEAGDGLLLRSDGKGNWVLPSARRRKADSQLVVDGGDALRLVPEETFLYSVFDVADSDPGYLVYRARLAGEGSSLPGDLRFFSIDDLPYDAIATHELRSMLRRYVRERQAGRFGIYMDSDDGGRVAMIDGEARAWLQASQDQGQ
ncbi:MULTISPECIES: flavin reductase [unclassified Ensifer]|uniref:flavin reductase n=1 Tax=unclassified Ensifer TaxID=2633371 RepID=UPI000709CE36|nr:MULTISPECIES: flavin reductase [unclassified Ensifer]KQW52648.1 flavin reductase [Ensifer sp. Root1252]KQW78525.1 flavin reductase [Ensifer sp. Root127]KRC71062.1 flavin reductase [Ensifer sp. Root231]KRC96094.1 flavin reductase [Ensifer sp. Root258]PSS61453.1 flavin reductase [Ensifer sp. NM-2]